MEQSTNNQLVLADIIHTAETTGLVIAASILTDLLNSLQTGSMLDWKLIGTGVLITIITAALTLLKRYLQNNQGGQVGK